MAFIDDPNLTEKVNCHCLGLNNIRLIKSKDQALLNYALKHKFDAITITETWLKDNDDIWKSPICLNRNGYHLLCSNRPEMKQGGGIGPMFRSDQKVKTLEEGCRNTFEYLMWQIRLKDKDQRDQTFEILSVYHPPPSENNKHIIWSFIDDFLEPYMELGTICTNLIIIVDFNIHVDGLDNSDADQLNDVFMAIGLEQMVNFGTHVQGHTPDLVLHESNSNIKIRTVQPGMYL